MEKEALEFARTAHGEQQRKYTKEPYIEHPKRVAETVRSVPHTSHMICAAYLHDVVEDTPVDIPEIYRLFGEKVGDLVKELTDVYMKVDYPPSQPEEPKAAGGRETGFDEQGGKDHKTGRCDRQYPRYYNE